MTRDDVAVILGMLREVYGKQGDTPNPNVLIDLWHRYLCDEPAELVQQAVDAHIATSVFAPKPAEILALVEKAKAALYYKTMPSVIDFNDDYKGLELPAEYYPRTHRPKAYELANERKVMAKLKGFEKIGLVEGEDGTC